MTRSPFYGRLYWSDTQKERTQQVNEMTRENRGSCIGRLEDGTEVEYNILLTNDEIPEPTGDAVFLGWGTYVKQCRTYWPDPLPLEQLELGLLNNPFVSDEMKRNPRVISHIAKVLQDYSQGTPYTYRGKDRDAV